MKYEERNMLVENVFSPEEIEEINIAVSNSTGSAFVTHHAQLNNFIQLPEHIIKKVEEKSREISGNPNIVVTEYCHALYKNVEKDGKKYRPSLFPHYDETFKQPRFTFDYQLKGNVDWEIVIENRGIMLSDNQAATFSGTHQIHWRRPTEFKDDQSIEMIFFHLSDPNSEPKSEEVNSIMDKKAEEYKAWYYENGGWTNG